MNIKKLIGPILLMILVLGVGAGIYFSSKDAKVEKEKKELESKLVEAKGITGSEKYNFLTDTRTLDIFRKNGIALKVEKSGSREMAFRPDLKKYDFAFPAGVPGASKIKDITGKHKQFTPFYTPMVIASWKPIAEILIKNGIVEQKGDYYYIINMKLLFQLIKEEKRWKELKDNSEYSISKSVLISTTDARTSNSAAMYLALASYILNNYNIVTTDEQVSALIPTLSSLFLKQGYVESSTSGPFEDYVSMGIGKSPLVMIYEAQFIEFMIQSSRNPEMVLLYPKPTLFTKHILVPFSENGEKVGMLLEQNEELQKVAAEYGYRINNAAYIKNLWQSKNIKLPDTIIDVVDPPSYEVLEKMIVEIEKLYPSTQNR